MTLGDRVVGMKYWRVQQGGRASRALQSARNKFVAGFICSPSMNFAAVTVPSNGIADRENSPALLLLHLPDETAQRLRAMSATRSRSGVRPEEPYRAKQPPIFDHPCFYA